MPDGELTTTVERTTVDQFIAVVHDEHGVERYRTPPLPTRTPSVRGWRIPAMNLD